MNINSDASNFSITTSTIQDALLSMANGTPVVVVDDEDRENEGDLIVAAERASPRDDRLHGPLDQWCSVRSLTQREDSRTPASAHGDRKLGFNACSVHRIVDVKEGTTTGISASERAATVTALVDPSRQASDFARPGHVFPLRAAPGGVLQRPGHT